MAQHLSGPPIAGLVQFAQLAPIRPNPLRRLDRAVRLSAAAPTDQLPAVAVAIAGAADRPDHERGRHRHRPDGVSVDQLRLDQRPRWVERLLAGWLLEGGRRH